MVRVSSKRTELRKLAFSVRLCNSLTLGVRILGLLDCFAVGFTAGFQASRAPTNAAAPGHGMMQLS